MDGEKAIDVDGWISGGKMSNLFTKTNKDMDGDRISMRGEELSHSCWRWRWGSVVPPTNLKDGGDNDANILYGGEKPSWG